MIDPAGLRQREKAAYSGSLGEQPNGGVVYGLMSKADLA